VRTYNWEHSEAGKKWAKEYRKRRLRTWEKSEIGKTWARKYMREYGKKYYDSHPKRYDDKYVERILKWKQEHPDGVIAQNKLHGAIRYGKMVKPEICENCGLKKKLSAHHEDYSKPLDVNWLCYSCHKLKHTIKI
jgi:hypothetical protein